MSTMKLSQLRFIVETAETRSITRAAQNLYMGQPNLSKAIKDIEAELGFPIFKRNAKGVVPTKRGEELIARAKELLEKADRLEEDYFGGNVKRESFTAAVCGAEWCIPRLMSRAADLKGDFSFECFRCDREQAFRLLENGEISFAVVRSFSDEGSQMPKERFSGRNIGFFKRKIAICENLAIAQKNNIGEEDIEGFTEVSVLGAPSFGNKKSVTAADFGSASELLKNIGSGFMFVSERESVFASSGLVVREFNSAGGFEDRVYFGETRRLSDFERSTADSLV